MLSSEQKRKTKTMMIGLVMIVMTGLSLYSKMNLLDRVVEGGLFGSIGWAAILLLGSIFFELHTEGNKKTYWWYVGVLYAFSLIGSIVFKIQTVKRGCSPTYVAFTSATAAVVFKFFTLFEDCKKTNLLSAWGGNSILLYTINTALTLIVGALIEYGGFNPGKLVALIIILAVMVVFTLITVMLQKKDKHIRV